MNIEFFEDPNLIPRPRDEVQITDITLQPLPGGQRIQVNISLTPFRPADRPNLEVTIFNPGGHIVANTSIIEPSQHNLSIIVHSREHLDPDTAYQYQLDLYYDLEHIQHSLTGTLKLPPVTRTP